MRFLMLYKPANTASELAGDGETEIRLLHEVAAFAGTED